MLWPISHWVGFSLIKLLRYIWEELLICYATTSSETVLPRMILKMEKAGCDQSVVGLVISHRLFVQSRRDVPLSRDRDGLPGTGHQDAAQYRGADPALLLILLLTSKGAAGVAGAAFVVLAATLSAHGTIPGRQHCARAWHPQADVTRANSDEPRGKCGCYFGDREVGACFG